jgi:hypothetical protein
MTVLSTLVFAVILLIVVRTQGYVEGNEFSPTHFQQRKFSFYELPLIHVQITPIRRSANNSKTADHVRLTGLIKQYTGPPATWHLANISRGLTGTTPRDPNLLIDLLNLEDNGALYWEQWSTNNKPRAQILWPIIQKLAERELYILMPSLFEIAQLEQTPQELQQNLNQHLRQQYLALIKDMQAAKRDVLAEILWEEAKRDYPTDKDIQNLQLESLAQ